MLSNFLYSFKIKIAIFNGNSKFIYFHQIVSMLSLFQRRLSFYRSAQLLLLLYGLTLGVATVSPVINPKILNLVCTSTGYKFITQDNNGELVSTSERMKNSFAKSHLLDCALCLPAGVLLSSYTGIVSRPLHLYFYRLPLFSKIGFQSVIVAAPSARGPP